MAGAGTRGHAAGAAAAAASPAADQIAQYQQFLHEVIDRDLQQAVEARSKQQEELNELDELLHSLEHMLQAQAEPDASIELKTLVDLGAGVHCRAHVPDTSHIYISIGLGFHVECTLQEAQKLVGERCEVLRARLGRKMQAAAEIKAHRHFVETAIAELVQLGAG